MPFVALYSVSAASLDQQVEAWLLSPLFVGLFLTILIKALFELPVFYVGSLLVVVALKLRMRLATPLCAIGQQATLGEHKGKKEIHRWIRFVGPLA